MINKFYKRKILSNISSFINYKEAIILYGARQVGKTTVMKMLSSQLKEDGIPDEALFYFDLENIDNLNLINQGVEIFVKYIEVRSSYKGIIFLFIDEIQYANNASSFIKLMVDNYSDRFKLVVSGSSVLDIKAKIKQSLVGRVVSFEMFGLDFEEFLWFKDKTFNLKKVLDDNTRKELKKYFEEFIVFGSYPRIILINEIDNKKYYLKELVNTYIRRDIKDIGRIRNIMKFNNFLRILADQTGSLINVDELSSTVGIARDTVYDYLMLLEGTYISKRVSPYFKNLRSELTKMPKIYFEDNAVLNYLKHGDIIERASGPLFENSIYSELRKASGMNAVRYWRTQSKQEIDFIVERGGKIFALEVKKAYSKYSASSFKTFHQKYPEAQCYIITLDKIKNNKESVLSIYPWEIYNRIYDQKT